MRKAILGTTVVGTALALSLAGCGSSGGSKASTGSNSSPSTSSSKSGSSSNASGKSLGKVGIILPDTVSSQRWVSSDPQALKAACKADNLTCDIQNANGNKQNMKTIAEQMENEGVKVLMIVNLDPASGASIEKEATKKGIQTVDYDRLTPGGTASLYVSYDNVQVGKEQAKSLINCAAVKGKSKVNYVDVNGSHSDNNATLFKKGYDAVLSKQPGWKMLDDQWIKDWDNPTAGTTFAKMLSNHPNINAVMVANDGMANAVISVLKKNHLNGKVAVSGQDTTVQGLHHIMDGDQCFTIYKPTSGEAKPAIDAIAQLIQGKAPKTNATVTDPSKKSRKIPAILHKPTVITKKNIDLPVKEKYVKKSELCAGSYAAKCKADGVK